MSAATSQAPAATAWKYARSSNGWSPHNSLRVEAADQTLLIAGLSNSSSFNPFEGATMELIDPLCGPESDGCGLAQHKRVQLMLDDIIGDVQSRDYAEIGAYGVWAPSIVTYVDGSHCADVQSSWIFLDLVRLTP